MSLQVPRDTTKTSGSMAKTINKTSKSRINPRVENLEKREGLRAM